MQPVVVYIHGLWLGGRESLLLRHRLSRALAAPCRAFSYPSVSGRLADNAKALGGYLQKIPADPLHLVAHSMGGLLVLKLFELGFKAPPGRVVLLGAPVRGSLSARRLVGMPLGIGRRMLGPSAVDMLVNPTEPRWTDDRELGVIAGDSGWGLGRVLGRMPSPNDGTVLVAETYVAGAVDRLQLPVSHSGMLLSAAVAMQAAAFLRDARFAR